MLAVTNRLETDLSSLESLLFELAQIFQIPILLLVMLAFFYAAAKLGGFLVDSVRRAWYPDQRWVLTAAHQSSRDQSESIESHRLVSQFGDAMNPERGQEVSAKPPEMPETSHVFLTSARWIVAIVGGLFVFGGWWECCRAGGHRGDVHAG